MKHILNATTGIALALAAAGMAAPAMADVDVLATITKTKDIDITETITVTKTVDIFVGAVYNEVPGGAEAQALLNVTNSGNEVNGSDASDPTDQDAEIGDEYNLHFSALIDESVNNNVGVFGFNQDVGNMSNQANVVSISGISDLPSFADAQAHAEQINEDNTSTEFEELRDAETGEVITDPETDPEDFAVNKAATISNSINSNTGVINVNQNSGNMNNQSNGVAAALGLGAVVALSDADLGQLNSGNLVEELSTVKVGSISDSINNNSGIINVNQSTGNMNNQGNVVSFAAITSGAILNSNGSTAP
jgi:hypothetical protein